MGQSIQEWAKWNLWKTAFNITNDYINYCADLCQSIGVLNVSRIQVSNKIVKASINGSKTSLTRTV